MSGTNAEGRNVGLSAWLCLPPEEWKRRCAARYVERTGLDADEAAEAATAAYEAVLISGGDGADGSPEDLADEDISYWTDDEQA